MHFALLSLSPILLTTSQIFSLGHIMKKFITFRFRLHSLGIVRSNREEQAKKCTSVSVLDNLSLNSPVQPSKFPSGPENITRQPLCKPIIIGTLEASKYNLQRIGQQHGCFKTVANLVAHVILSRFQ